MLLTIGTGTALVFVLPRRRTWKPAAVLVLALLLAWVLGAL